MKQIIVATDFSVPAEHAMLYAGLLAQKLDLAWFCFMFFRFP